ncbi:uncharacterized protein LOC106776556 [Vigna radiata var. radiata]|uniref:Uncharacterized protein LOC106776556 n=1 Tax=Vigna radiata var. radiata TaxID=3916 RepID=A0A1S3VMC0_VIGRR|nr:uncharacterized protein LOC106776556 [Vigna radiata var. radiata]
MFRYWAEIHVTYPIFSTPPPVRLLSRAPLLQTPGGYLLKALRCLSQFGYPIGLSAGGTRKGRISTARIPASWIPATRIPASRISPTAWLSSAALPRPGLSSAALRSSIRSASAPAATKFTELWLLGRLFGCSLLLLPIGCVLLR